MERFVAGDVQALGEVYDRYAAVVGALVLRILGDADGVHEIVVEVFVQAWRHAESFDTRYATALEWLSAIARARAIDRLPVPEVRAARPLLPGRDVALGW